MYEWLYQWAAGAKAPDALAENVPLARLTTFAIGGPARFVARPSDESELVSLLDLLAEHDFPCVLLGRGSNVLAEDEGYPGCVILLTHFDEIKVSGTTVTAGAGVMLGTMAQAAKDASLTGLEFASGIPGTLGGALFMNAGAYGGEMCQIVRKVLLLDDEGKMRELTGEEMEFSYRHSLLQEKPYIALRAEMELAKGNIDDIRAKMAELAQKRRDKQPLEYPSAGSAFKRPEGYFAGALIEQAQLKGVRVGGAVVSPKHAGFIVNTGKATSDDVQALFAFVQKSVLADAGVELHPEVRILRPDGLTELE